MEVAAIGMTPAKTFPWPTPYGQSPDSNVLTKAIAAPQAPAQNFLPLNPQPQQNTPVQTQQARVGYGGFGLNRARPMRGMELYD